MSTHSADIPVFTQEELYAQKWDRCATKALQYTVPPAAVGAFALFWKPRLGSFMLTTGISFGLGMAYAECSYSFKQPDMIHVTKVRKTPRPE